MFWRKIDIFSGPKIFKSVSAVRPHRVLSNEVSHDHSSMYMAQCKWSGLPNIGRKGAKMGQRRAKGFCFVFIKHDEEWSKM